MSSVTLQLTPGFTGVCVPVLPSRPRPRTPDTLRIINPGPGEAEGRGEETRLPLLIPTLNGWDGHDEALIMCQNPSRIKDLGEHTPGHYRINPDLPLLGIRV